MKASKIFLGIGICLLFYKVGNNIYSTNSGYNFKDSFVKAISDVESKTNDISRNFQNMSDKTSEANFKKNILSFNFNDLQSLQELEINYRTFNLDELQAELQNSKLLLFQTKLIEKANQGSLNESEAQSLAFEIRRQTVLHKLIIDSLIEDEMETI